MPLRFCMSSRRALLGCAALLAGCRTATGGACDIVYLDPLVSVVEVKDAVTQSPLASVRLHSLYWNGNFIGDARFFTEVGPVAHGVTSLGGEILCQVACGFGVGDGLFTMTVHRDGYRDTTLSINASYSKTERTCPIRVSEGVTLRLVLAPL